jgi:multidrug efflux pump subunit AcrA (membrane-fusion protein)
MIRWLTILLATAGLCLAIYTVATARHQPPKAPLEAEPSINPFASGIAATGIVESASRDIQIAAPEGALATRVFVEVGDKVKVGDPLFELDPRPLQADLAKAKSARESAEANLKKIQAAPRVEEIPPLEAQVKGLEAMVSDWTDQWERLTEAQKQTASNDYEVRRRWFLLENARSNLVESRAKLALLKAGAWGPDVDIAKAQLAEADAAVRATETLLERRTVRAPIAGSVLKRNVDPGEFAPTDAKNPSIILGDLSELHIRARVDEEDLPRLRAGSHAVARIRGQKRIEAPLEMIRIEPFALPKTDLSGATTERVDTRVLEVLFRVIPSSAGDLPLYPGQLVDVFIECPEGQELPASSAAAR